MPNPSERVNLAECASHGRPPDFVNASPIAKRIRGAVDRSWKLILTVLAILAVAGIAYFIGVAFVFPPTITSP
jgi:hypothetical protein